MKENSKIYVYIIITTLLSKIILAQDVTKEADWKSVFGSLGSIGFYFSTIINWLQYIAAICFYIFSVLFFIFIVTVVTIWLPLKIYPTYVRWNNIMQRIFKLT